MPILDMTFKMPLPTALTKFASTVFESSCNGDPAGFVRVYVVDPTFEGAVRVHVMDDSASSDDDSVSSLFDAFDVSL